MTPDRVTIEITGEEYVVRIMAGDTELSVRRQVMLSSCESHSDGPGDIHDDLPLFPTLAEEIDDLLGFPAFDVAGELLRLQRGVSDDQV